MSPETLEWLIEKIPEFAELDDAQRNAVFDFSMLWSLFEGAKLSGHCNMHEIREFACSVARHNAIDQRAISEYLPYLQQRYFNDGNWTNEFHHLHIERSGNPQEIRNVLSGLETSDETRLIACLGVIFRLRNNLFHGEKWRYQLRDQYDNFTNASAFLRSQMRQIITRQ